MTGRGALAFCPAPVVDDYGHLVPCRLPADVVDRIDVLWVTIDGVTTATWLQLSCDRGHRPTVEAGSLVPLA
jgi:hypothetical protein